MTKPFTLSNSKTKKKKPRVGIQSVSLSLVDDRWMLFINDSKHGIPATDIEVFLWQKLNEQVALQECANDV